MGTATISRKGWVVIPKEIRERHRLKPGDKVRVVDFGGQITIIPEAPDAIAAARGMLKGGPSLTKTLLEERRLELEEEEAKLRPPRSSA